jgi:hypothetical protein
MQKIQKRHLAICEFICKNGNHYHVIGDTAWQSESYMSLRRIFEEEQEHAERL